MVKAHPSIKDNAVYLCDNGAAYCGKHLGASARMTGHDISGFPIYRVTPEAAQETIREGYHIRCEKCGMKAATQ